MLPPSPDYPSQVTENDGRVAHFAMRDALPTFRTWTERVEEIIRAWAARPGTNSIPAVVASVVIQGEPDRQAELAEVQIDLVFSKEVPREPGDTKGTDSTRDQAEVHLTAPAVLAKRSTERGEGTLRLIAALTKHHQYAEGGCLNLELIALAELVRKTANEKAGVPPVAKSTASGFFKKALKGIQPIEWFVGTGVGWQTR